MNAATALGISVPSDAAAYTAVFSRYLAESTSGAPAGGGGGAGARMTLEEFAKFVRDKLGASATKEDVLRALEALAEEGESHSPFVSLDALRGVCPTEELLSFVVSLYDEAARAAEGEGGEGDDARARFDYRMLASTLFAV